MSIYRMRLKTSLAIVRFAQPLFDDGFYCQDVRNFSGDSETHVIKALMRMGFIDRAEKRGRAGYRYEVTESGYRVASVIEKDFSAAVSSE